MAGNQTGCTYRHEVMRKYQHYINVHRLANHLPWVAAELLSRVATDSGNLSTPCSTMSGTILAAVTGPSTVKLRYFIKRHFQSCWIAYHLANCQYVSINLITHLEFQEPPSPETDNAHYRMPFHIQVS